MSPYSLIVAMSQKCYWLYRTFKYTEGTHKGLSFYKKTIKGTLYYFLRDYIFN